MSYISISDKDKRAMLESIGVGSVEELFSSLPEWTRVKGDLDLPGPMSELELTRTVSGLAAGNRCADYLSFLGGGAYDHFIPAVVDQLSSRGEFVTPYTPYQPEVSQGTLQVTFEFQTLMAQLTGLDIANASLYDGSTGAAEAALMAHRVQGKTKLLVSSALHPQYREVIRTYFRNLGVALTELPYGRDGRTDIEAAGRLLDGETAAVLVQSPNYFGVVEDLAAFSALAHGRQALSVVVVAEALSLGVLEAPGRLGADIVTGEGQSFGIPLSYGGPYLGFLTTKKDYVRQMPGRVVGMTKDVEGRRGFVLTLATREQHIRREKATSNICTNQALCAVRAAIFLETLGRHGLTELARQNAAKAAYAAAVLSSVPGAKKKFSGPFFNEFVLEFSAPWAEVEAGLRGKGILGGLALGRDYPELAGCALVCVTEMRTREEIDGFGRALKEVLS
jgi:glycine dehydrogenase subunit 1